MQCYKYDSTKHFASNCPHQNIEKTNLTKHITLVTGTADFGTVSMLVQSLGKGILDSVSTKTVSCEKRMNKYIKKFYRKKTKRKLFVVKQKVNLCLDLGMVWTV